MVNGNIGGIKKTLLERMEHMYDITVPRSEFITPELIDTMAALTTQTGREISVFLSRQGRVLDVSVGDQKTVQMPYIRKRRGDQGLSGVRCIHTHPEGSAMLSDVDLSTLLSSRLDAMAAVSVHEGEAKHLCVGFIGDKLDKPVVYGPFSKSRIPHRVLMNEIAGATRRVFAQIALHETEDARERAMLIGLNSTPESMLELRRLADTADVEVVLADTQMRERDRSYYIGKGKARELSIKAAAANASVAITNDELSPLESKNLEDILGLKVLDRTMLILDIFAKHAKTKEGKLQVELAQLKYNLPRLQGMGFVLSRLGGGIGTRGPGEKKLEVDRRRVRRRIYELEGEIDKLSNQRRLRRNERIKNRIKSVALIGYTNAGKSSLLNALSNAGVEAGDKLFATLDPVTKRVKLPSGTTVLFTDTVGFIDKLPHDLVNAFRSTLEETLEADLLLNVIDSSNSQCEAQSKVVYSVLESIGAAEKPVIDIYNKADLLKEYPGKSERMVYVSAKDGTGLQDILEMVDMELKQKMFLVEMSLDYARGDTLALIREHAQDLSIEYTPEAMNIHARLPADIAQEVLKAGSD